MNWLLGGQTSLDINIILSNAHSLPQTWAKNYETNEPELQYLLTPTDTISGNIHLTLKNTHKKFEHMGIKLFLIGSIEFLYDRSNPYEFLAMSREFEPPGELYSNKTYPFDFGAVFDKNFETYSGTNVRLRYYLKVKVTRSYVQGGSLTKVLDLQVQKLDSTDGGAETSRRPSTISSNQSTAASADSSVVASQNTSPSAALKTEQEKQNALANIVSLSQHVSSPSSIKMEVGIEDCLHIEFEYSSNKFHLNDVVIGKIYFLLVRIKIKYMELVIIRRESCGTTSTSANAVNASSIQPNVYNESENLAKFEIMDGAPVRGELVPIRLFLSPYPLTPTYRNIGNKFSVRYYLNLVLVDEEDRRYFKQQEITLWRKQYKTANLSEPKGSNLIQTAQYEK